MAGRERNGYLIVPDRWDDTHGFSAVLAKHLRTVGDDYKPVIVRVDERGVPTSIDGLDH